MKIWKKIRGFFQKSGPFPSNILVTAPHGSAAFPLRIIHHLSIYYQTSPRLLLNFSDYGTKYLIEDVPESQKVIPRYGRMIGDPNRSLEADDLFRFSDFGGNKIFRPRFERRLTKSLISFYWRNKLLNYSYKPFYRNVYQRLENIVNKNKDDDRPIILIDLHDTGNRVLGRREKEDRIREEKIPTVVISNAPDLEIDEDGNTGTAPEYLMNAFAEALADNLGILVDEIKINKIFKGGNMIRTFGNPYKNQKLQRILKGRQIFAIQVEFNRGLYLNEINQRPHLKNLKRIQSALMETLRQLGDFQI